jgi:hypothetical protein
MTRQVIQRSVKSYLLIAVLLIVSTGLTASPQPPPPDGKKDTPDKVAPSEAEKETRRAAEQVVGGIEVELLSDEKWNKVNRIEKPLLLFSDSTREYARGSLWAWGDKGRPVALLELFQDGNDRTQWIASLCNTSGRRLRAKRAGAIWWGANDSTVEIKDIPQAPAPATDSSQRQRQMKLLAQKFTGHEFWDNSRFELRRIERPVHTYRDEATGVLEGGLFILANGTNPEILLFIEARVNPKDQSKAAWQFLAGRSADGELHLEYDGKDVFNAPRFWPSDMATPYWARRIDTKSGSDPEK